MKIKVSKKAFDNGNNLPNCLQVREGKKSHGDTVLFSLIAESFKWEAGGEEGQAAKHTRETRY